MKHVALLRGVNVGGNNKVPMADLRRVAEGLGWDGVSTYINSGNLFFDAPRGSTRAYAEQLEAAIAEHIGVTCRALVLTASSVRRIADAIPAEWPGSDQKADVIYLLDGVTPKKALAELPPREGVDQVVTVPGALIWMVDRKNATRSALVKIVGTPLYRQSTIRASTTARKLAELTR